MASPDSLDYFVGGEVCPILCGTASPSSLDYFVGGEVLPGFSASASAPAPEPTLAISPSRIPASVTRSVTFIGTGTTWLTDAPTFTATDVADVTCGAVTVVSDLVATADVTTDTATGVATWTDSTTDATASQRIGGKPIRWISRRR